MTQPLHLSVNVDHVATVRQARKAPYPDPVEASRLALEAGARGITVHLREDRRHIQDEDVRRLREELDTRVNLEIAATGAMVDVALELRPHQVSLVPERPDEITTEGGLDLVTHRSRIQRVANTLSEAGVAVSLFLDPEEPQIEVADQLDNITGFEINTDAYTTAFLETTDSVDKELSDVEKAARAGEELGLEVYAGHGLTTGNVGRIAALPQVRELNIGHAIVARAVLVGMKEAVAEMLAAMAAGRDS